MSYPNTPEVHRGVGKEAILASTALVLEASYLYLTRKREFDPKASLLPYCQDIASEVGRDFGNDWAIVGGMPIDVFNASDSLIDPEGSPPLITADSSFDTSLFRLKGGTLRDYDIILYDRDKEGRLARVPQTVQEAVKKRLEYAAANRARWYHQPSPIMSVCSFENRTSLVHSATMISADGGLYLAQGRVVQDLPENAMATWRLKLPSEGVTVNILNPWEQYWRSMIRFASGPKPKDFDKLDLMLEKLRATPGLAEQEDSELCKAYRNFYEAMTFQNSMEGFKDFMEQPGSTPTQVARMALTGFASYVLNKGQQSETLEFIVLNNPGIFNRLAGSR